MNMDDIIGKVAAHSAEIDELKKTFQQVNDYPSAMQILDIVKKGTYLPLHSNYRCAYVADLDEYLLPPSNPDAVNFNHLSNEQLIVLLTRKENMKLDTPEKLVEYYKLQLTKMENGSYEFYDKKNNCKIEFPVDTLKTNPTLKDC